MLVGTDVLVPAGDTSYGDDPVYVSTVVDLESDSRDIEGIATFADQVVVRRDETKMEFLHSVEDSGGVT